MTTRVWRHPLRVACLQTALLFLTVSIAQNDPVYDRPLAREDHLSLRVLVENLNEDALAIGLTESRIRNRVELRLLQAGIDPIPVDSFVPDEAYLYININAWRSAASINVEFRRLVVFSVNSRTHVTIASVWTTASLAALGSLDTSNGTFVLDSVETKLDEFLVQYLRDNR